MTDTMSADLYTPQPLRQHRRLLEQAARLRAERPNDPVARAAVRRCELQAATVLTVHCNDQRACNEVGAQLDKVTREYEEHVAHSRHEEAADAQFEISQLRTHLADWRLAGYRPQRVDPVDGGLDS